MILNRCGKQVFKRHGFALIEVLIAVSIMSIIVLGLYSGISTGSMAISQNKNLTKAIIIARSKLNELQIMKMKSSNLNGSMVDEYPEFTYDVNIEKFEHELLGPLPADMATIVVHWQENGVDRSYSIEYIYPK